MLCYGRAGFRTPASVHPVTPEPGRHPKTLNEQGHSAVSMTLSSWKERGVCTAGAAHVRMTGKSWVWKTQALCATMTPK